MAVCSSSDSAVKFNEREYRTSSIAFTLRARSEIATVSADPGTPRPSAASSDSLGSGAGFLASTGYMIRLAHNQNLPQDKGVLLCDRGSLPIYPKESPQKNSSSSSKPAWPSNVPSMCVGAHVRIGKNKIGVVDKWLPGKSKWAVTLANGEKKAYVEDSMQPISSEIARRQKVTVIDRITLNADPDDPDDEDVTLALGTRGIITAVDDEDGGAFMEFECLPGSELPIDRHWFSRLQFYNESLALWTYFHDSAEVVEEVLATHVDERASSMLESPSDIASEFSQHRLRTLEDTTMAKDPRQCTPPELDKENILTQIAAHPDPEENCRKGLTHVARLSWSIEQTAILCKLGGEAIFEGKSSLMNTSTFLSVSAAIAYLNCKEGFDAFPDGHCVVFSDLKQSYFLLYRSDKKALALELFNLKQ